MDSGTPPTDAELEILAVLWQALADGQVGLRLSDIHRRLAERRKKKGQPEPAVTTLSVQIRGLQEKGLVDEVNMDPGSWTKDQAGNLRSTGPPAKRSPFTGYRTASGPGETLQEKFKELASVYPEEDRLRVVLDVVHALELAKKPLVEERYRMVMEIARALELPKKKVSELEKLLGLSEAPG